MTRRRLDPENRSGRIVTNLIAGLVIAVCMLGSLEAVLRVAWWLSGSRSDVLASLQNRNDPSARNVVVPTSIAAALGNSRLYGVQSNVLTYPDPQLLFHVRPNPTREDLYCYQGIDALGYRNAHPLESVGDRMQVGKTRILLLGDSCAFGWGICAFDETLAAELERLIGAPTGLAKVVNLAQPGYSTEQGLVLFRRWFPELRPDFVVLYYGWNDLFPTAGLTDRQILRLLPITQSAPARLLMETALFRTLTFAASRLGAEKGARSLPGFRPRVPLEESQANMLAMIDEARAGGASVLVVLPPHGPQFARTDLQIDAFNRAIAEAVGNKATLIRPSAMDPNAPGAEAYFIADGYHPNAQGARLLAEAIADAMPIAPTKPRVEMAISETAPGTSKQPLPSPKPTSAPDADHPS